MHVYAFWEAEDALPPVLREPEAAGAGTFWSEPVKRSGSGSTLDKTVKVLNDILFISSHIDKRLFNKQVTELIHKWNFSS